MASKRRSVGYCLRPECAAYAQGFLLDDAPLSFDCPVCLHPGKVETERGVRHTGEDLFSEVRVEFDYDPIRRVYRQVARAREGRLLGAHNIYTLQSPLINTHQRAQEVARVILRSLNRSLERPAIAVERPPSRNQLLDEGWPILV